VTFVPFVVKMLFALNLRDLRELRGKSSLPLTFVSFVFFVVKIMLFALNLRALRALRGKNALCS